MCCWCVFASLIPAGPLKRNCGFLLTTTSENCGWIYTTQNKAAPLFQLVVRFSNFGSLRLHVFSVVSLLQSPLSLSLIPLPGALDRWALGAVFYLMAHTVSGITPPITSLRARLPRRARDPRNTLLANSTWGPHLTIAGGAWDTWRKTGNRGSVTILALSLPGASILRKKFLIKGVVWHSEKYTELFSGWQLHSHVLLNMKL